MVQEFKLPDVGEGLTEAEIVSWKVKPGDTVKVNDILVEIETAKSLVELPSPYAGTIARLCVDEGQTIEVGRTIVRFGDAGDALESAATEKAAADPATDAATDDAAEPATTGDRTSVLVGYGPRSTVARRRPRKTDQPADDVAGSNGSESVAARPRAKPPVRKRAKDLGIDLTEVYPTGPDGTVTRGDVEAHTEPAAAPSIAPVPATGGARETRVPVRGVRKRTAEAMVASAFSAPHATEWVTIDATGTMRLIERLAKHRDFRDLKVSPMLVVAKACLLAARRTPEANARWDDPAGEIVLKHDINLGIAAATPRGLVVPNVKGADQLSLAELCRALGELTATARAGKTTPADMQGTTFTITNVGVFGIDGGTPILNPGESAILAMGAIAKRPWIVDDEVVPRWVTTLSLSFDHRIVDGEQGSRFLADVAAIVEDPGSTLIYA